LDTENKTWSIMKLDINPPFSFNGKKTHTISRAIFNSFLYVYQRVSSWSLCIAKRGFPHRLGGGIRQCDAFHNASHTLRCSNQVWSISKKTS
jgi:hypothetical protein